MKKVKDYIKKNPEPAKGRFGVNPFDPWSVKYNVAEEMQMKKTTVDRIQEARKSGADKFRQASYDREKAHKEFLKSIEDKPHAEKMKAMMDKIKSNLNKEEVVNEVTYADAKAADPSVMSPGEGVTEKMTTIQRVKSIHKKLKEELYDHEKEDKSVATYGKKPKLQTTKKEDSFGENKPEAALTMTGGTTLTGNKRDTIEIDPMMKRNRPGQPDITNKNKDK
jgi:hypothetical protein